MGSAFVWLKKLLHNFFKNLRKKHMSNLYFLFLQVVKALDSHVKVSNQIDVTAMLLLNEIAIQHFDKKNITVTQAMSLKNIASPATLHRKLDELRDAGLIDFIFEGTNRRTKFLVTTKYADAYFEKMSLAISNAANS
jgi:DNA-binding MarR family transcriptional regulator